MAEIHIVPIGLLEDDLLQDLANIIAHSFGITTEVSSTFLDPSFAFDSSRNQYNSTAILKKLIEDLPSNALKFLGVTDVDLYIPILTFVYGEAQLDGPTAVVSKYRLRNEFYGLPNNKNLLQQRLEKEAVHELGHTFGLIHCVDYGCVMHSSTYVEEIDLKPSTFCLTCNRCIQEALYSYTMGT